MARICELELTGRSRTYKLCVVLLSVNPRSINWNRQLVQLYFTDFTRNSMIGPQGTINYEYAIGDRRLESEEVLMAQIPKSAFKTKLLPQIAQVLGVVDKAEFLSRLGASIQYLGVLCEVEVSNTKLYNGRMECDLINLEPLLKETRNSTQEREVLFKKFCECLTSNYVQTHNNYLKKVVPIEAQRVARVSETPIAAQAVRSNVAKNHQKRYLELRVKEDEFGADIVSSASEIDSVDSEESEVFASQYIDAVGEKEISDFETVLPITVLNSSIEDLPLNKLYTLQGKIVEFHGDILAYKLHETDVPKVKDFAMTITNKINSDNCAHFVITPTNSIVVHVQELSDVFKFFQVREIEHLYVNQTSLLEQVQSKIRNQIRASKIDSLSEFKICKSKNRYGESIWCLKEFTMNDI